MKHYGTKTKDGLVFDEPVERGMAIAKLQDGQRFVEEIKRFSQDKSAAQVRTLWGVMAKAVVEELNSRGWEMDDLYPGVFPEGVEVTKDWVMDMCYFWCCEKDDEGKRITISRMNTKQARDFFERCRNFLARKPWLVDVPDPIPFYRSAE